MPSQEDLAIFAKQNMEYVAIPLFLFIGLYLPGCLLVNIIPFLYVESFLLRQFCYVFYSMLIFTIYSFVDVFIHKHQLDDPLHKIVSSEETSN